MEVQLANFHHALRTASKGSSVGMQIVIPEGPQEQQDMKQAKLSRRSRNNNEYLFPGNGCSNANNVYTKW
eukprot:1158267-Pelagomonas_calceolata.AAC.3